MRVLRSAAAGLLLAVLPAAAQGDCPEPPCAATTAHAGVDDTAGEGTAADDW